MSNKKNDDYGLHDNYFDEDVFNDIESDDFNDINESDINSISLSYLDDDHDDDQDDEEEILNNSSTKDILNDEKENIIEDTIEDFDEKNITNQSLNDLYEEDNIEKEEPEFTDDDIKKMKSTPDLDSLDNDSEDDDKEELDDYEDDLLEEENTVLPIEADLLDEKFDDNIEEDMYSIQDQILLNTQSASNYIPPTGINLIEKPNDNIEELKTGPGTISNAIKVFGITCLGVATLFLAGIGGVLYADYNKTPETIAAENNVNASQGTGDPVSDISNQLSEGPSEENNSSLSQKDNNEPVLGENDSKITYRVTSQGDVDAASVSYIEGKGEAKQQNGINLPDWEQTVAVDNSSQPYIGISWTGGGTINCEIIKDGQNVGTQGEVTSLADDKTVSCQ